MVKDTFSCFKDSKSIKKKSKSQQLQSQTLVDFGEEEDEVVEEEEDE